MGEKADLSPINIFINGIGASQDEIFKMLEQVETILNRVSSPPPVEKGDEELKKTSAPPSTIEEKLDRLNNGGRTIAHRIGNLLTRMERTF